MLKRCSTCKRRKPTKAFSANKAHGDGLQTNCRACDRKRSRAYYAEHRPHLKALIRRRKQKRVEANRQALYDFLKVHPCIDCGEDDPVVLDFDHVKPKRGSVTTMALQGLSWETILKEIEKCEIRCANCHRRKTSRAGRHWRSCR